MKTLVLIRHGKSSWDNPTLNDRNRPLKKRAYSDADLIIEQLVKLDFPSSKALSSPAKRAFDTAEIICKALNLELSIEERLYFLGESEILNVIRETAASVETLLCFGHQPSLASLTSILTHQEIDHIPTTGVAIIDFSVVSWGEISTGKGQVRALLFPKMFR